MKQTVVTLKIDFVGNKAEAINKALRLIHREMDQGRIIGGTISEVGNTYDIKTSPHQLQLMRRQKTEIKTYPSSILSQKWRKRK